MKLLQKIILWILFISITSCHKEDNNIQRLWQYVNNMADRIAALEMWQETANHNLLSLQQLIDAMQSGKLITSVVNIGDGYKITFSDETSVIIKNGEKGEKGEDGQTAVPIIAVRDSSDGNIYWTVNGNLLKNSSGEPVPANGLKGEQGETGTNGITPQLRINETNHIWEVSLDSGNTWESLGVKAIGEKGEDGIPGIPGDAIFATDGITIMDEYVEFTLADGKTKFRVLKSKACSLIFPQGTLSVEEKGKIHKIPFVVSAEDNTKVKIYTIGNGGWTASVKMNNSTEGDIFLSPPPLLAERQSTALVFLSDSHGRIGLTNSLSWQFPLN